MTCEVAIMNNRAIALAADSAVTVRLGSGTKIYNTVDKLFELSKCAPISIMFYGNASYLDTPWETIINIYKEKLDQTKFGTLQEYCNHFLKFLQKNILQGNAKLVSQAEIEDYFESLIVTFLLPIKVDIDQRVKSIIEKQRTIDSIRIKLITTETINIYYKKAFSGKSIYNVSNNRKRVLLRKFNRIINQVIKRIFKNETISISTRNQLKKIALYIFYKEQFVMQYVSGVIIAGFGEKEIMPHIVEYQISGYLDKLLFRLLLKIEE